MSRNAKATAVFWIRQSFPVLVLTAFLVAGWGIIANPNGSEHPVTTTFTVSKLSAK